MFIGRVMRTFCLSPIAFPGNFRRIISNASQYSDYSISLNNFCDFAFVFSRRPNKIFARRLRVRKLGVCYFVQKCYFIQSCSPHRKLLTFSGIANVNHQSSHFGRRQLLLVGLRLRQPSVVPNIIVIRNSYICVEDPLTLSTFDMGKVFVTVIK
jgi:hypothetical protein